MARGLQELTAQIRAAATAGDAEAVRPLLAEFREKAASYKRSQANARETYSALDGMSGFDKFHQGMASGLVNVGRRAGQLLTPKSMEERLGVSDKDIENQQETDRELSSTLPGGVGRFVTEAAVTAPVGGGVGTGVKAGLGALKIASAVPRLTRAAQLASEGATMGELTSGKPGEGALWNLGIAGVLGGAKKLIGGAKVTPEANRLMDEGVEMTPGQMNPRGALSQFEQGAERLPIAGPMVRAARGELQQTGMQKLLEKELNMKFAPSSGFDDMIREANKRLGKAYDNVRAQAGPVKGGGGWQMEAEWTQAVNNPAIRAGNDARKSAAAWLENQMSGLKRMGQRVSGEDLLAVRQALRKEIREANVAGDELSKQFARVLEAAEASITTQINHALPGNAQQLLKVVDSAYAKYKPLEGVEFAAASRAGGTPTIPQVIGGLKKAAGQSRWSGRGGGRNQQFIEDLRDASEAPERITGALLPVIKTAGLAVPGLLLGLSKTGRKAYAGRTGVQRAAQRLTAKAKSDPSVGRLIELLRRGSAGPLSED